MNVSNIIAKSADAAKNPSQNDRPRADRPPIEWEPDPAKIFEGEHARVTISRSKERFPRYSYRVGGQRSPFLRPHVERSQSFNTPDFVKNGDSLAKEVSDLLLQAAAWVDEQLKEQKLKQISSRVSTDAERSEHGKPNVRQTGKTEKNRNKHKGG